MMADLEAAHRARQQAEVELQRAVTRAAADDDLYEMFAKAIAEKKEAVTLLGGVVADAEARLAADDADAASLTALSEYAERVQPRRAYFVLLWIAPHRKVWGRIIGGGLCADEDARKDSYIQAGRFGGDEGLRRLKEIGNGT